MKYQNINAFEKHLQEAFPHHPSFVYLVVAPSPFEREVALETLVGLIKKRDPAQMLEKIEAEEGVLAAVTEKLYSPSLFGGTPFILLDGIDKIKNHEALLKYVVRPVRGSFLLLGASSLKPLTALYQQGKKEMVVLDLSDEKPWEKQKRVQEWVVKLARKEGKEFKGDALSELFARVGYEMTPLAQEVAKVCCYGGEKKSVELEDVKAVISSSLMATGWSLSEALVWGSGKIEMAKTDDLAFFLPLLGQIRYHLQLGAQIASLLDQNLSSQEIAAHFPNLRSAHFEKYKQEVQKKKRAYFVRGLKALYEIEVYAKSSFLAPSLLLDLFVGKLRV